MAIPRSLEVELETVTPMWTGGANLMAELRSPSMRGSLRAWFRALVGGVLGENLAELRAAENAVYGSTSQSSSVVVRLRGNPQIGDALGERTALPGVAFLFWTIIQQRRTGIFPGERFHMRFHDRVLPFTPVVVAGRTLDRTARFDLALASLWLMVRLGGTGGRGRRGAGTMRALANPPDWPAGLPPLVSKADSVAELAAELSAGVRQVRAFTGWQGPEPAMPSSFDILHDRCCTLYLVDRTFPTWWEAINWVGERFLAFRTSYKDDATGIAGLLTRGRLAATTIARAILGLPLSFFFKSIHATLVAAGVEPREARRKASAMVVPVAGLGRASPLFLRVFRLPDDPPRYVVLMGVYRAVFLPDPELLVKPSDFSIRPVRIPAPRDFKVVDDWFRAVDAEPESRLLSVAL
jgi:CRISPR-associated protein Cmr1